MDTNELIELARAKANELAQMSRTMTEPRVSRSSSGELSTSSIPNHRQNASEPKQSSHSAFQSDDEISGEEWEFESSSDSDRLAASQMGLRRRPLLIEEKTSLADSFQAAPSLIGRKPVQSVPFMPMESKSSRALNISRLSRSGIVAADMVDQQTRPRIPPAKSRPHGHVEAEDESDGDSNGLDSRL
jgi:hypothetical protein